MLTYLKGNVKWNDWKGRALTGALLPFERSKNPTLGGTGGKLIKVIFLSQMFLST